MNPTLIRAATILYTAFIAGMKAYRAGTFDIIVILESIDWATISAAVVMGWVFLRRPDDKTKKQVEQHVENVVAALTIPPQK